MADLVLHPDTARQLVTFKARPGQAILVVGPDGIGKGSIAGQIATSWLKVADSDAVRDHAYSRWLDSATEVVTIEAVRELHQFLSRKVPGAGQRLVIIEHADNLGDEAQNALLKALEEPPVGTLFILTTTSDRALLPTIVSRTSRLPVTRPTATSLDDFFKAKGHTPEAIGRARLLSGGLPGLLTSLLDASTDHPLYQAAQTARELITSTPFERLCRIETLAKDRQNCLQTLAVMQEMAHVALVQGAQPERWQKVLTASYEATTQLRASAQPKLVLTNLMLSL